jgi:hypothetical protein
MKMQKPTTRCVLAMMFAAAAVASTQAQAPEPEKILPPTIEGSWVRTDTNGSGQFDALTSKFKPAELTAKGKEIVGKIPAFHFPPPKIVNGIAVTNPTPCIYYGGQLRLEFDSEGFIAVISKDEVVFVQDRGGDRHVYLDKRELPGPGLRTPTVSGYSVGHVEPDGTLVVTVSDMTPGPVTAGGYRTTKTVLEERFIPDPDGQHLKLVMTWNDPEIYAKPHTYEYTFERTLKGFTALDEYCDATNPLEGQSVAPPAQK